MKYRKTRKGITLIEITIALALSAIILSVMFSFYMPHQKALMDTEKRSQLQMDAQNIMQYFSKSAMEASKISALNGIGDSTQLNGIAGTRTVSALTFEVDDQSGTRQYVYQYSLDGKKLNYTDSKVTNKLIADDVNSITIEPVDGQTIGSCSGISINLELISSDGKMTYKISDNLYFRNKVN